MKWGNINSFITSAMRNCTAFKLNFVTIWFPKKNVYYFFIKFNSTRRIKYLVAFEFIKGGI